MPSCISPWLSWLTFAVKAWDEKGPIGSGTHTRAILKNEKFLAKAPEDVIQRERDNLAKAQKEIQQLESSLADLG